MQLHIEGKGYTVFLHQGEIGNKLRRLIQYMGLLCTSQNNLITSKYVFIHRRLRLSFASAQSDVSALCVSRIANGFCRLSMFGYLIDGRKSCIAVFYDLAFFF